MLLCLGREYVVAKTEIEGQPVVHSPIVLHICACFPRPVARFVQSGDTRNSHGGAENEVRQPEIQRRRGVTGRRAERERAARRGAVRKRELPAQQKTAELYVLP